MITLTKIPLRRELTYPATSNLLTTATEEFARCQLASPGCLDVWVGRAEDEEAEKRASLFFIMNWDSLEAEQLAQASPSILAALNKLQTLLCPTPPSTPIKSAYKLSTSTLESLLATPIHPVLEIFEFELPPSLSPSELTGVHRIPAGPYGLNCVCDANGVPLATASSAQVLVFELNGKSDNFAALALNQENERQGVILSCWRSIEEREMFERLNVWFMEALEDCGGEDGWTPLSSVHVKFRKGGVDEPE